MYNKIYLANKFKKEYEKKYNFIYDYMIRIELDLIIKDFLPKEIFEDNNKIFLPTTFKIFYLLWLS